MYPGGGPRDDVAHNIRNERRAEWIDKNPALDCEECGQSYPWRDYWKPRVERMDNPREEPWLCDDCKDFKKHLQRKREAHKQLAEWVK